MMKMRLPVLLTVRCTHDARRVEYKKAAITGILACPGAAGTFSALADEAGKYADAMLAEDELYEKEQANAK